MIKNKFAGVFLATAAVFGAAFMSAKASAAVVYPCDNDQVTENDDTCSANSLAILNAGLALSNIQKIIIDGPIAVTSNTSLDISGKAIESTSGGFDVIEVSNGAKLTISGNGSITKKGNAGSLVVVEGDGTILQLDGGTYAVDAANRDIYGVYLKSGGKIIVNSGAVIDTTGSNGAAIGGNNTTGYMYAVINGGTLKSKYQSVYMPQQVSLDIKEGSTLEGGIVARMGHITIDGGTINGITDASSLDQMTDYYNLNDGYPWVGDAIAVMGGTYVNDNDDHDNSLELVVRGGTFNSANGHAIAIYDMGKVTQTMTTTIEGGVFNSDIYNAYVTDIVANPVAGYGVIENNPVTAISGGEFYSAEPNAEYIDDEHEIVYYEADEYWDEFWEVLPKEIDYEGGFLEDCDDEEGHLCGWVDINKPFVADRESDLSIIVNRDDLKLTGEGELILAADFEIVDRNGDPVSIIDNDLDVYLEIDEDTYNTLAGYDKVFVVYFENGVEVERFEAELINENSFWYAVKFKTSHMSTYGVAGVKSTPADADDASVGTPETGVITRQGGSATVATLITSIFVGLTVSVLTFTKFINSRWVRGE